jgi:hypothetical protein
MPTKTWQKRFIAELRRRLKYELLPTYGPEITNEFLVPLVTDTAREAFDATTRP